MKTAEWVSPKHPDKMCDQISDAILDHLLKQDPKARVAVETMGGHGKVYITGEITAVLGITTEEIKDIVHRITGKNEEVFVNIVEQSPDIANGVDTGGAGDQGIMVGYACRDNDRMIPQEKYLCDLLGEFLYEKYPYDGKTQITIDENKIITKIVASFQNVSSEDLLRAVKEWIGDDYEMIERDILCNPAGDWSIGGFDADTGLTGRKLMVDNYGPQIPIGGGAFSGKDPSKVDRSGAYMARYIATDLLKKHNAKEVKTALAYAIGVAQPVMNTANIDGKEIDVTDLYDCTPQGIIKLLDLKQPIYEQTAQRGHFGNKFNWDK